MKRLTTRRPTFLSLFLAILCCNITVAQPNPTIDSLITHLPSTIRSNESTARQMILQLENLSKQHNHHHALVQSIFFKAWISYRHNPPDTVIASIDSALQNIQGIKKDTALVKFYILKGQCFVKKTQFANALHNFNLALQVARSRTDKLSETSVLISIGWAYMEDNKPAEAIRFFNEVLQINPSENYLNRALLLNNIASCYNTLGEFKTAESFALKGIATAKKRESKPDMANGLNILGRSYYQQGQMAKAISVLKEAAVVREANSDPSMLASDYLELADLYTKINQPREAIAWAKKAETISAQHANNLKLSAAYRSLANAYESLADHRNASAYLQKLLDHKDSLANEHYNQAFAQMQVQFETEKKTSENLRLRQENLETKLQNSYQQRWLLLLVAILAILIASGIYISKLMKSRYKMRLAIGQLNEQKKRSIAVVQAEEKERKRIAADLHDGVGQMLAAASLQLNKAIKGQLPLEKVDELLTRASTEVRNLSHQVTPELLLHYGLVKAIEHSIDRLNESNDKTVFTLFTHIEEPLQDEVISLTIYRCFQELSTNILKHAQATNVTVQLDIDTHEAQLLVEDNGIGFQRGNEPGLGLKNIESRVALFDGVFLVDSTPGKGSTIIVRINRQALG
jgi:two-component system, NarL family, sensor kinase